MRVTGFKFQPRATVEFTETEIALLKYICEDHYDATVRSLVPPGRGAIINGLIQTIKDGVADADLTNMEVQLLCKACEMAGYLPPETRELGKQMYDELYKIVVQLENEWRRVNPELAA